MTEDLFAAEREKHFPMQLVDGIVAHSATIKQYFEVSDALAGQIFPETAATARHYAMPNARVQGAFSRLATLQSLGHQDAVIFYDGERPIGYSAGRMEGASNFLMDETGILPDYQRRGIYSAFLPKFLAYLRDLGYERVISQHSPTNRAVLIAKLKAGFIITGTTFREDAGAQVRLTYFLHEDRYQGFENTFSLGPTTPPEFD